MSDTYAADRAGALEDIREAGVQGFIRKAGAVTPDPDDPTPWDDSDNAPAPPGNHPVWLLNLSWKANEVNGTSILATDRKVLIAAEGVDVEPVQGDGLVIRGQVLTVQNVWPLAPDGIPIMWTVNARA